ncbi:MULTISPECIES: AMP-binding protein [Bacillus]|uniref:Acyl-CoA synthetase n=2 Tax=Bacillus TaxID=1386 RepID=A0A0M5JCK7_9BACI|nr:MULTISPECIES: AMP-binding protein [Bacillus]ALC83607.1 acyl-CoA synthetase [Bacillus gobiensis]MBP1082611.1 long-chain acyl-CoA synthetase [Bacillus capparidis]MED1097161.1 AMP-binding protein [Bacillus capparidis]
MAAITQTYDKHRQNQPERIAVQMGHESITYREWQELVAKTANWLTSLDKVNRTIGILLPNGIPFLQLFAGASSAGLTIVPLDPKWKKEELEKRLQLCSPSFVITTKKMSSALDTIGCNRLLWENCKADIQCAPQDEPDEVSGDLPFFMGFTSGSTGAPKAFVRSHDSWIESFACNRVDFNMHGDEHVVIPGALIHSHFLYGAISTLYLGGTVYLLEKFSPSQTISFIEAHSITTVFMVPTMIEALMREKRIINKPLTIISSGAKWEADSKRRIRDTFFNLTMYEFYGAGELSFITVLSDQNNRQKPRSVGKACHNVEIKIVKSNQEAALPNEVGKIYVRSKMISMGYVHEGSEEIHSLQDECGWSSVDDMGYLDEDGFLYIAGREKNMILYGGMNIFPEEIEAVLTLHPEVEEAAVVGISDPYWGQVVTAVIKGSASKPELRRLCQSKLASYKVPRKWHFFDEIPHTTSGKLARQQMKEMLESKVSRH